jgi:enoyl-CoA hydratase/carnithine racemase
MGSVELRREGVIATVVLSNPGKMNALSKRMWMRVGELMRELSADESLRCVVLKGEGGKAFAAGADISEFGTERANAAQAKRYGEDVAGSMRAVAECLHPTVAVIEGACIGGGLELASQCDLRICGESSRFGVPIKNLGLVVAYDEMAGLMALAGRAVTLEILLEGRVFGAAEAYD